MKKYLLIALLFTGLSNSGKAIVHPNDDTIDIPDSTRILRESQGQFATFEGSIKGLVDEGAWTWGIMAVNEVGSYHLKKGSYQKKPDHTPYQDFLSYSQSRDYITFINGLRLIGNGLILPYLFRLTSFGGTDIKLSPYGSYKRKLIIENHKSYTVPPEKFYKERWKARDVISSGLGAYALSLIYRMWIDHTKIFNDKAQLALKYLFDQYQSTQKTIAESGSTPELENQLAETASKYHEVTTHLGSNFIKKLQFPTKLDVAQ